MPPILDGLKATGYHYATKGALTVSVYDATVPPAKTDILAAADEKVAAIDEDYEMGLMSAEERHRQVVESLERGQRERSAQAMAANFDQPTTPST